MQAADAAERLKELQSREAAEEKTGLHKFENQAALMIAFLAMLLAINSVAGSDNLQAVLQSETEVTNNWAFYQARNIRRTSTLLTKDQFELQLRTGGAAIAPEERQWAEQRMAFYEAEAARFRDEPEDGMQALLAKGRELEAKRNRALKQDPNFDLAEGLFQISIVIASVSILTKLRPLLITAGVLGVLATLLLLNGFFLFADLPF